MADEWDQFPDAPTSADAVGDPFSQFPDAPDNRPSMKSADTRHSWMGPVAPYARAFEDFTDYAIDPFGMRDEIVGAGEAVKDLVTSGGDFGKAGEGYTRGTDRIRKERKANRERFGSAAPLIGDLGTAGLSSTFRMAPTLAGRIKQSVKAGAGFGAVAGFGQGEGGVGERLQSTATGAALGGALGPLVTEVGAPLIGGIARATIRGKQGLGKAVSYVRGQQRNADERYLQALDAQNMTPRQALRRINEVQDTARFGKTQLDPRYTPADLGPVTQNLADTASLVSKESRNIATPFLQERARGQFGRIIDYLKRSLKVTNGDFARTQGKLIGEQRQLSKKAYDQAYADPKEYDVGQVLFDADLSASATAGPLKRALDRARNLFIDKTRGPGYQASLDTKRFDSGKRALDDMIEESLRKGRNNEARLLIDMKNKLLSVIDDPNTGNAAYKAARDIYGSRAEMLDALSAGRDFMKGDVEFTSAAYKALSTAEKRMFRIGVAREMRKTLGRKQLGHDMVGAFDKPNVREVLGEIMTPKQAQKFYQLIELEQALAATNQAVRGNSRTAERQQNILDFSLGVRLGRAIKDQGLYQALTNEVFDQVTKAFAMREADAVRLTRMLFETNPNAQRAELQRLIQTYGPSRSRVIVDRAQRIARRQVANARRALAGITGEMAGGFEVQQSQPPQTRP